jgi:hypothetical protein
MVWPLAQVSRSSDGHIYITVTRPGADGLYEQVRFDLARSEDRVEVRGQVIWYEESERVSGVIRDEADALGGTVTLSANPFEASAREWRIHYDVVGKRQGRPLHVDSTVLVEPLGTRR